ncbi:RNA polymerase sigma factor [Sphaerisporangium perillae]|uniref:RNA polymerase sigma factor n=1 Tax=Sphaerisporangium perillae TaxID=2935860 RepID=UPI00200CC489|nr:sigma-70 family RNA polymerase sigma factor [Sphaerisporangium perillae]
MSSHVEFERQLLRELAPQVLGALVRHHGSFDACEDALQEALVAATTQWPTQGVPTNPKAWLITVASRRFIDRYRSDAARADRERALAILASADPGAVSPVDDTLTLFLMCCHPSLTPPSQVALTLRAVGGLTTAEIARGLLVPEATVAQRISRAKQRIKASGTRFRLPDTADRAARIRSVMEVLYLIFTEGSTASSGPTVNRVELSTEAIRLARQLHVHLPDDGEIAGLLALMLLTEARSPARNTPSGDLVPLSEQDRTRWDAAAITEGTALITHALQTAPIGPYQLQAAIAAVHDEAGRPEDTDWSQILVLYDLLTRLAPGPMVTLNRIVALGMAHGPAAGLEELRAARAEPAIAEHYRFDAVHGYLLDLAGDHAAAKECYAQAARRTFSLPEQRYLQSRARVDS